MCSINVRIGHQNDFAVARLFKIEGTSGTGANHLNNIRALGISEHIGSRGFLDIEDFPSNREKRLVLRITRCLCGSER